jgi:hypothetical protein
LLLSPLLALSVVVMVAVCRVVVVLGWVVMALRPSVVVVVIGGCRCVVVSIVIVIVVVVVVVTIVMVLGVVVGVVVVVVIVCVGVAWMFVDCLPMLNGDINIHITCKPG